MSAIFAVTYAWLLFALFCDAALEHRGIEINKELSWGYRSIGTYLGELLK